MDRRVFSAADVHVVVEKPRNACARCMSCLNKLDKSGKKRIEGWS
jgi:hypothetical protein